MFPAEISSTRRASRNARPTLPAAGNAHTLYITILRYGNSFHQKVVQECREIVVRHNTVLQPPVCGHWGRFGLFPDPDPQLVPTEEELAKPVIDLLALVNPERDAVQGQWCKKGKRLLGASQGVSRPGIRIPKDLGDEYILKIRLRRVRAEDGIVIGLVSQSLGFTVVLEEGGSVSGLSLVDDNSLENQHNPTRFLGAIISRDHACNIICVVRKQGVQVICNGTPIINCERPIHRLSLPPEWESLGLRSPFLSLNHGEVEFLKMELIPLSAGH